MAILLNMLDMEKRERGR